MKVQRVSLTATGNFHENATDLALCLELNFAVERNCFRYLLKKISDVELGHGSDNKYMYHELVSVNNRNLQPREACF